MSIQEEIKPRFYPIRIGHEIKLNKDKRDANHPQYNSYTRNFDPSRPQTKP